MNHPKLERGQVWCKRCGRTEFVNAKAAIWFNNGTGWPKCCGETMTLDSPEERATFEAVRAELEAERAVSAALAEVVENFIRHAAPLAALALSQWADDHSSEDIDLCQATHWLNVTSQEANVVLACCHMRLHAEERRKASPK